MSEETINVIASSSDGTILLTNDGRIYDTEKKKFLWTSLPEHSAYTFKIERTEESK